MLVSLVWGFVRVHEYVSIASLGHVGPIFAEIPRTFGSRRPPRPSLCAGGLKERERERERERARKKLASMYSGITFSVALEWLEGLTASGYGR